MVRKFFKGFGADESGAVTVDWVVLSAAVLALSFLVFTVVTRQSVNVGAVVIAEELNAAADFARNGGRVDE